eukprot:UN26608
MPDKLQSNISTSVDRLYKGPKEDINTRILANVTFSSSTSSDQNTPEMLLHPDSSGSRSASHPSKSTSVESMVWNVSIEINSTDLFE